ncbi:uncharacterized protein Dana_GF27060 [Drosophila ananassae]|uniref:PPIase cyclophilin-type domain-containing protein n=1 Tax=Drosophila ananassae TaxID=7217 RepID=A0A0P8Y8N1_DROAN|nr:uncharacterized protein LOC26514469 [Drosophila ananassae]KPU77806.1 uncharacterized protein Dana_GF27060 [Drosophila ananassae]
MAGRSVSFSEFYANAPTTRNCQLRAHKVASELLANSKMVVEKLPKNRVPNYMEFRKVMRSVGNVKPSDINVTTFKSMVEMRQAQIDHNRLKLVKSYGHSLETKPADHSYIKYRTQLCTDLQQKQNILHTNLSLLGRINKIQRLNGSVKCFNRTAPAVDKHSRKIRELVERLSQENRQLGCRLSQAKAKVKTRNPWVAPLKPIQQKASDETVARFRPYLPSPRLGKRNSEILLRPILYFDITVGENMQFLGRMCLQLYTEISPEVVLEFVRLATHNDVPSHRVLRIFPDLWMENEIIPDPADSLKEHHSVKRSFLDHSKLSGILSYPWDYRRHFPQGLLSYTISFKPLAVEPLQRVVFGRVCSGLRVLQNCRDFGTKNGKTKKKVVVSRCGLL